MSFITIEPQNNIAIVRLNNRVTNAINQELVDELADALKLVKQDFNGLVLAGGDKFFSIGLELPRLITADRSGVGNFFDIFNQTVFNLFTFPLPTVCAIKGHAIGAGKTLALACDYRFATAGRTLIGLNEIKLGVPNPYPADLLLRQVAGDHVASDMLFRGELLESAEAAKRGLLHDILPKEEVESKAVERVTELANLQAHAFRATKANRVEELCARYEKNIKAKMEEFLDCWFHQATQELLKEGAKKF